MRTAIKYGMVCYGKMSYFNTYTLVSLDSCTMHILDILVLLVLCIYWKISPGQIIHCISVIKNTFSLSKKYEGKKLGASTKIENKTKKWEYFQNIFLKICKYCHIDAYFFQFAKQYKGKNTFMKNSLYVKNSLYEKK